MGMDVTAKLVYGYPAPEIDYENPPAWFGEDEDYDIEAAWDTLLPEEIKNLDLTDAEKKAWNAIPYSVGRENTPEYKAFLDKYRAYLEARRGWLKQNPCPVKVEYAGHGDGGLTLLFTPLVDGKTLTVEADWEAVPVDLGEVLGSSVTRKGLQETLDDFCATVGLDPDGARAQWYLVPLYF